jgi:hypothetical protein
MKYLLAAAFVLLLALCAIFFLGTATTTADPNMKKLGDLAELAERTCLVNTQNEQSAALKVSLQLIATQVKADASASRKADAVRGAAQSFSDALKKVDDDDIRACMKPWAEKIRGLADALI